MNNNKGFVLMETIIVMSVIALSMIVLYSTYNKIISNSGSVTNYDNVQDIYTAYYAYKFKDKLSDENVKGNLDIVDIYYFSTGDVKNIVDGKFNFKEYNGSTINYINSIKNSVNMDCDTDSNTCLTIVKLKRNNQFYFAKYEEAYNNQEECFK